MILVSLAGEQPAQAYRIKGIEVPGYTEVGALGADDRENLRAGVPRRLGGVP